MNLALRGISHNLGDTYDSSFTNDLHKGMYFNYIMANPPFNLKGWYNDNLKNDSRWADYVTPPESNANYAWSWRSITLGRSFSCQGAREKNIPQGVTFKTPIFVRFFKKLKFCIVAQ